MLHVFKPLDSFERNENEVIYWALTANWKKVQPVSCVTSLIVSPQYEPVPCL